MNEELKQRLRDMSTLSDSRTPKDALKYIEALEDELFALKNAPIQFLLDHGKGE